MVDYNLKTPWDLAELKKDGFHVYAPIVGSATECLVDLKLGRFGNQEKVAAGGSSRKARGRSNGAQGASCLVDGCRWDLSTCRDYHRRHKVCEVHSKTAIVTVGGQERRFCQQCSRFHSLVEFDEGKRSCRKRLDGHNRRRRKPQPETITLNPGRFLSNHQGARYIPFGNLQACTTGPVGSSGWVGAAVVKPETHPLLYNCSSSHFVDRKNSFLEHSYNEVKRFPFLQGATSILPGDSITQAFPDHVGSGSNHKMFVDGHNHRALSLLSSPPSKPREFGFTNAEQTSSGTLPHSSYYNNLRPPRDETAAGSFHPQAMSLSGLNESSASTPHQTLFFSWE